MKALKDLTKQAEITLAHSIETSQTVTSKPAKLPKDREQRQQIKNLLIDHLVLIGRQYEIPKDPAERSAYIGRWHHTICENNTSWPFGFDNVAIYQEFLTAVRDGRVNLPSLSAFAHAMAFKDWVRAGNLSRFKPQGQKALPMPTEAPKSIDQQIIELKNTINFCESNGFQLLPENHIRRQSYDNAVSDLESILYQQRNLKNAI